MIQLSRAAENMNSLCLPEKVQHLVWPEDNFLVLSMGDFMLSLAYSKTASALRHLQFIINLSSLTGFY